MTQTRLFLTAHGDAARRAYQALDATFEEDGFPLAMTELDEAADRHEISVYADGDLDEIESRTRKALEGLLPIERIDRETLPDIDWVAHSLKGLQPVRAGRFFVHGGHDRHRRRANDLAIEIEAGQAFGTGHHGTTAGCLEMLTRIVVSEGPCNVLDLGTGSAVLAIAVAKLAHIPVLATDIDPVAIGVAKVNVRRNGVEALVKARTATGFMDPAFAASGPFDLIVANILANPLMRLAPAMARHLAPCGSLVLSGILERQRHMVLAAYSNQRFRHVATLSREGWVTLHLKR